MYRPISAASSHNDAVDLAQPDHRSPVSRVVHLLFKIVINVPHGRVGHTGELATYAKTPLKLLLPTVYSR
jgi:hypothetical protein